MVKPPEGADEDYAEEIVRETLYIYYINNQNYIHYYITLMHYNDVIVRETFIQTGGRTPLSVFFLCANI